MVVGRFRVYLPKHLCSGVFRGNALTETNSVIAKTQHAYQNLTPLCPSRLPDGEGSP